MRGKLTTEKGGVITGPGIRIQAKKIVYTRQIHAGKPSVVTIEAEGEFDGRIPQLRFYRTTFGV